MAENGIPPMWIQHLYHIHNVYLLITMVLPLVIYEKSSEFKRRRTAILVQFTAELMLALLLIAILLLAPFYPAKTMIEGWLLHLIITFGGGYQAIRKIPRRPPDTTSTPQDTGS